MNRTELIEHYRTGTADLTDALAGITAEELDRPQADGEWTARQVVHHLADGEAMSFTRLRRLVADDQPVIQGSTSRPSPDAFTTSGRSRARLPWCLPCGHPAWTS